MANDDFVVDLSNYKDRVGSRVEEGRYRVQVEDAEITKSSNSGNSMVVLFLRVLGGPQNGSTLVDRLVLTENSMFRVVGFMQAIGIPTPRKRLQLSTRNFVGKMLDVDVADGEPYNGRVKSEVRGYMRAVSEGGEGEASDVDEWDGLDTDDDDGDTAAPETPEKEPEPAETSAKVADLPADDTVDLEDVTL